MPGTGAFGIPRTRRYLGAVLGAKARSRIPAPWRRVLDWVVTIGIAVAIVLVFEAEVAKPYRIPSESMEPTLHCAGRRSAARRGSPTG